MRVAGWILIGLFGALVVAMLGQWVWFWVIGEYPDNQMEWTGLAIIGVVSAFAAIPIGIGVWLVVAARRQKAAIDQVEGG